MPNEERVAVITGAASGIGFATAKLLAEKGWRIVMADVEAPRLEAACAELAAQGEAVSVITDVRDKRAVDALADASFDRFGRVDVVFSNAGVSVFGPVTAMTHADWDWLVEVNLWGPIHSVESFLPRLIEQGKGGHLLFTSSYAGLVASPGLAPYSVTKYGVVALAEVLNKELRRYGIGASVFCPMMVATDVTTSERNRPDEFGGPAASPVVDAADGDLIDSNITASQVLTPNAVAEVVVAAIGTDRLYIFSHPEMRAPLAERFQAIDQAFGG